MWQVGPIGFTSTSVLMMVLAESMLLVLVGGVLGMGVANALVLRHGSWASLDPGDVEGTVKASVVAQVPEVRGLTKQLDQSGLPARLPRPLARGAEAVLGLLGEVA